MTLFGGQVTPHGNHTQAADTFTVTTEGDTVFVTELGGPSITLLNANRTTSLLALDGNEPQFGATDLLTISGLGGDDILNALGATNELIALHLKGDTGNDVLRGSVWADVLDGGLGDDTFTGSNGVDLFYDAGGNDKLDETFNQDLSLFGNLFVVGKIVGDDGGEFGKQSKLEEQTANELAQEREASLTIRDGREGAVTPTVELIAPDTANSESVQQTYVINNALTLSVTATSGTFRITDGSATTATIAFDASAATIETALQALSPNYTDKIFVSDNTLAGQKTIRFSVATPPALSIVSGGAAITTIFQELDLKLVGDVVIDQVWELRIVSKDSHGDTYEKTYSYTVGAAGDPATMVAVAKRLADAVNADTTSVLTAEDAGPEPIIFGLTDTGDRYTSLAEVESLVDARLGIEIFEEANLVGGVDNNTFVVNDSDNSITVGSTPWAVTDWRGKVDLDNLGNNDVLNEYYLISLKGTTARYSINDSVGGSAFDEVYLLGTSGQDEFTLDADGPRGFVISGIADRFELPLQGGNRFDRDLPGAQRGSHRRDRHRAVIDDRAHEGLQGRRRAVRDLQR